MAFVFQAPFLSHSSFTSLPHQLCSVAICKSKLLHSRIASRTPTAAATGDLVDLGSLRVSALGVGTWAWGDRLFWGYGRGEYTDDDLYAAYKECRDAGINFFDTAEVYGNGRSETLLAEFGERYGDKNNGDVIMATKCAPVRFGRRTVEKAANKSMERLKCNSLDFYQLHFPSLWFQERVWDELGELYQRGIVKNVGVSNYSQRKMKAVYDKLQERGVPLASNQVQYSLLYRNVETNGIMETANELGVKILAYSPLEKGVLTGKFNEDSPGPSKPPGARALMYRELLPQMGALFKLLDKLGQKYVKTPGQVALNWVMCKGAIPIPGCKTAEQARENAGALGWRLQPEDVQELDKVSEGLSAKNKAAFNLDGDRLVPEI